MQAAGDGRILAVDVDDDIKEEALARFHALPRLRAGARDRTVETTD
jgi:hypothetical protein